MKNIMFAIFTSLSFIGHSQNADSVDKLVQVTKEGLQQKKEVAFDNQSNTFQVGEWIIPVSKNTLVKLEQEDGRYEVEFSLQKGTTIRSTSDPNWRRASFALSFNSRQAAKNFIRLFQEITEKENVN